MKSKKVKKFVANLHVNTEYVMNIRNLKIKSWVSFEKSS